MTSKAALRGVQTVNVPVGGRVIFEVLLREPGNDPFDACVWDTTKDTVGVLRAVDPPERPRAGHTNAALITYPVHISLVSPVIIRQDMM